MNGPINTGVAGKLAAVVVAIVVARGCTGKPPALGDADRVRGASQAKTVHESGGVEAGASLGERGRVADLWQRAPSGTADVAQVVRNVVADGSQRTLLVYVGASWCEPCVRFHEAVERGEVEALLPGLRFLEFDADADRAALANAGYDGRMIPRFVRPGVDGRATSVRIEGSVKGEAAVANIVGRLRDLLGR